MTILPPGTDVNSKVYGKFEITFGKILWMKSAFPFENTKIRLKLWGQSGNGRLFSCLNSNKENFILANTAKYEIRCPMVLFRKYLEDMSKIRIDVLDRRNDKVVGVILIHLNLYLKRNQSEKDLSPM